MRRCVAPRSGDAAAGGERGSAVPFALAALAVVLLVGSSLGVAGAFVVDHRRAQTAADLAALAGATALGQGAAGCESASRIADRNGARVTDCETSGDHVTVAVEVDGPTILGESTRLSARARAGPG